MRSLKVCADKIRNEATNQSGHAKKFYKAHLLKENTKDIEYLKQWIWTIREIMNKQRSITEVMDIRRYFVTSSEIKNKDMNVNAQEVLS